jgi:hypothetical protein
VGGKPHRLVLLSNPKCDPDLEPSARGRIDSSIDRRAEGKEDIEVRGGPYGI